MTNNKYCPDCGKLQKEGDLFCKECGTKVDSSIDTTNNKSTDSQQLLDSIEYGKTSQMQTTYIEQTSSSGGDVGQNYVGIASIIISCLGAGFFIIDNPITELLALVFGIIGVIVGIFGLFQPHKKALGYIGILLGLVSIALWLSFYFDWL